MLQGNAGPQQEAYPGKRSPVPPTPLFSHPCAGYSLPHHLFIVALGRAMHELQRDTSTYLENAAAKYRHLYVSPEFLGFFSKTFGNIGVKAYVSRRTETTPNNLDIQVMLARMDLGWIVSL